MRRPRGSSLGSRAEQQSVEESLSLGPLVVVSGGGRTFVLLRLSGLEFRVPFCILASHSTFVESGIRSPPPQSDRFGQQAGFNEEAAQQLERLAELCAARGGDGSVFRERGFKSAAGVLRRLGVQITGIKQLQVS